MPETYTVDEPIVLYATVLDKVTNIPYDPVVIRCHIRRPSGAITTVTYPSAGWTHNSPGVYEFTLLADFAGVWTYEFESDETHRARYLTVKVPVVA